MLAPPIRCLRLLAGVFAALATGLALADQASTLDAIRAAGVLRVGTTGDYKPFSYRNAAPDGIRYIGIDIDMAASLAQALGVKLELVPTSWPALMHDHAANRFDVGMGGISVTPERQKLALFSNPYLHDGKTAIARCEHSPRFNSLSDIDRADVRVIVNPGGTNERFVRSHLHQAVITVYPDNVTIFDQLVAGKADVMITDAIEARLQQRLHPALCAVHPDAPFEVTEKAWLLPRDLALKAYVDQWLAAMQARGEMDVAFERWLSYPWDSPTPLASLQALMRERLVISIDVARAKWNSGAPIEDLKRENDIITGLARQAGVLGLPVPWAEQFFRAQIEASKSVQRDLHARWREQGQVRFDNAPDLARDIRPRIDALTPRLLAAITSAWPQICDPARRNATLNIEAQPSPDISPAAWVGASAALAEAPACSR